MAGGRPVTHGHCGRGKPKSPTWQSWKAMKGRCYHRSNAGFKDYGARGIRVCKRWYHSFPAFLEDMGERPEGMTLDRIDSDGHYTPKNCRWATWKDQAANRKRRK